MSIFWTKEIINDRLNGLPDVVVEALSDAVRSVEACFEANACVGSKVGKCLEVLSDLLDEVDTESLSDDEMNALQTVQRFLGFVVQFALTAVVEEIGGTIPPVEGPNCTAEIMYLPPGSTTPVEVPGELGSGFHVFMEVNLPVDASYSWIVEIQDDHFFLAQSRPVSAIVGSNNLRYVVAQLLAEEKWPVTVEVRKTVD